MATGQRRRHQRFPVDWMASVTSMTLGDKQRAKVMEISRSGLTVACDTLMSAGEPCSVYVDVVDGRTNAMMYVDGVVINCSNQDGSYRYGVLIVGADGYGAKLFERVVTFMEESDRLNG